MKELRKIVFSIIVFILLLSSGTGISVSSYSELTDIEGHRAENILRQAYNDRLIDAYDGRLYPDENLTAIQALAMLCRAFNTQAKADISSSNVTADKWYYSYAARAVYFGLIVSADAAALEAPVSRQDAFYMLAEAFQLAEAGTDITVLKKFSDSGRIAQEKRRAIAALVSQGLIGGYNGKLDVDGYITRATFLTVFYRIAGRIIPDAGAEKTYEQGILLRSPAELSGASFSNGVWFDGSASDVSIRGVTADKAIIRSNSLKSLKIGASTRIGRLTLAAQSGDIAVSPESASTVDTLVVGSGAGMVTVKGVGDIEITGDNRRVTITDNVKSVIVSGRNCTVYIQPGARAARLELQAGAYGSGAVVNGNVEELIVRSQGTAISGSGYIATIRLFRNDTKNDVRVGYATDYSDIGLEGASVSMTAPASLSAGSALRASATIENAIPGKVCGLTWYVNGVPAVDTIAITGETLPGLTHSFEYSRFMPETANIKVEIRYTTSLGEQQALSAEKTVRLQNYGIKHWMAIDAPDVLKKVTTGYKGDYTLEWAQTHDISDYEKEVWIYAKGYTSESDYLLWISIAYQRVNIFQRADGYWKLIRTCIVGTGRSGKETPVGVWTTSYKEPQGWTTADYTVKPVVRFMGWMGYAFHSRLYSPGTTTISDPSIGYPISKGCIRMYDEDIKFIYDNIPAGTTVVVY